MAQEAEKSREMADFELKKGVIRTSLISLPIFPLGVISQVLGVPLAFSFTPSSSVERASF